MSGVAKGVGKVFKKVAKVAKTVLPIALGVGALVFTAGAALGVPGTAGGWGGAVSRLVGSMGAGDVLTNTLTGALTTAGYGAVLGGAIGGVTGGGVLKGAQYGTVGGAAAGAVLGATDTPYDPFGGINTQPAGGLPNYGPPGTPSPTAGYQPVPGPGGAMPGTVGVTPISTAPAPLSGGAATGATTASRGFLKPGGWLERNQALAGSVIGGVGTGLLGMAEGEDYSKAAELSIERDERERAATRENYGSGDVKGYRGFAPVSGGPTPVQRYDPPTYRTEFRYVPEKGRIERVPIEG